MASEEPAPESGAEAPGGDDPGEGALSEEEMRAQLEQELGRLRVEEVLLQSVASIVNLTARRIAKPDEQDLEQGRVGIEAVRALVGLLPADVQPQIRNALSELQMLYAREAGGEAAPPGSQSGSGPGQAPPSQGRPEPAPPGRPPPPKLWTPPSAG